MPSDKAVKMADRIVVLPIDDVIPYWRNPRRNDKTVDYLVKIIPEYGWRVPIVVDQNHVVVKGHARLKAAKRLGMNAVPCIISDATPEEIKQDRILDNKIQELSYWEFSKLELEFERIGDMQFKQLFVPETMGHVQIEMGGTGYKPVGLDEMAYGGAEEEEQGYDAPDDAQNAPDYAFEDSGDGVEGDTFEDVYGASKEQFAEQQKIVGPRKLRTICPYCGRDNFITV